jgi:hypothetical protein
VVGCEHGGAGKPLGPTADTKLIAAGPNPGNGTATSMSRGVEAVCGAKAAGCAGSTVGRWLQCCKVAQQTSGEHNRPS